MLYILCCTSYQISSFIKIMIVSWNFQRQNVDRLFYFARDLTLIISITQEMTSEQKYLKQREWIDFCVRRQNLLQKILKRIWTWIKNNRSWQKFYKNFVKFEENYFDLIFIVRQIRDIKQMTKEIMSHIANIWEFNFRVFKILNLHTLKFMKKCARIDYTMIEILQLFKKIVIYRLHHLKKEIFKKILSTTTNWIRLIDEFRMQESISENVLKAFNLRNEKLFLSREKEQSTFAHINLENSGKIIQDLIKALMNKILQFLFTLKSTSTKLVKKITTRWKSIWFQRSKSIWFQRSKLIWSQRSNSIWFRRSDSIWSQRSKSVWSQRSDSVRSQRSDSARSQRSDSARSQSSDSVWSQLSDSVRSQSLDSVWSQSSDSAESQQREANSKQTQTTRFKWEKWLRLSRIKRYMKTRFKETWWQYSRWKKSSAFIIFDHLR